MILGPPNLGYIPGLPFNAPAVGNPQLVQPKKQEEVVSPEVDFDRSINYLADYSGCGHWRMIWPEHLLNAHQKAVIHSTTMMVLDERYYDNTCSVRIQRQATDHQLKFVQLLRGFANKKNFKIIYEIDDIVFKEDIPDYNKFKPAFVDDKIRRCSMEIMGLCDEITVTNKFMQEYYRSKTGNQNVTVIPNYPPKWWMGNFYNRQKISTNFKRNKKRPRIVYSASGAHFDVDNRANQRDDFFHVNEVIMKTMHLYKWVFLGAYPLTLHPYVQKGIIEYHPWNRLYEYPQKLSELDPTLFIAPLVDNVFNKAKSDLKYIEACCYGIPVICQDLCTYENAPYRFTTGDELIDQIQKLTKSYSKYMKASDDGYKVAQTRWLELDQNIDKYAELYKFPYKSPERNNINLLEENR